MGIADKMWDGITRVIRMDAKVEGLAATIKDQQARIEGLTSRVIRLDRFITNQVESPRS